MSEGLYRSLKLVLLAIFVFGSLYIGSKIGWKFAENSSKAVENGRYAQWDQQKDWGEKSSWGPMVVDTRSGDIYRTKEGEYGQYKKINN